VAFAQQHKFFSDYSEDEILETTTASKSSCLSLQIQSLMGASFS